MRFNTPGGSSEEERRKLRHDLRTPINHILSYADLVREDAGDRGLVSVATEMAAIESAGKGALKLVNDLLESHSDPTTAATSQSGLVELMREVKERVDRVRRIPAAQATPQVDADLTRIADAAERLLELIEAQSL